jgi:hypothetical protein
MILTLLGIYAACWIVSLIFIIITMYIGVKKENKKFTYQEFIGFAVFVWLSPFTIPMFLIILIKNKIQTGEFFR